MLLARLYRLLLLAYPASLRAAHGDEMAEALAARWRDTSGLAQRARLLGSLLADVVTSLPREWRAATGRGARATGPAHRGGPMSRVLADGRSALRLFRQAPLLAFGAVLTLGLGIGATTAVVSLAGATVMTPLPIPDPDRVYQSAWTWSYPDFRELERDQDVFTDVAAFVGVEFAYETAARTAAIAGLGVSGRYFALAGVRPVTGRLIDEEDDRPSAPAVAVLGERFWRRHLGADRAIVGRTIRLSGRPVTVVGIAPARFRGLSLRDRPEIFVALPALAEVGTGFVANRDLWTRQSTVWLQVVGRLTQAVTPDTARAAVEQIYRRNRPPNPTRIEEPVVLQPIVARALGVESAADLRTFIGLLAGAAAAGLLLACATVANLLLVRTAGRRRELAIRAALGGGRARLMRMVLTESLAIGGVGGLVGITAAWATLAVLGAYSLPGDIPVADLGLSIDRQVLLIAVGSGLITSLLAGAAPVWSASRVDPQAALGHGARTSARQPFRTALVAVQVGVCVVLLAGGLAFGRALHHALVMDLGFDTDHTAMLEVDTALGRLSVERAAAFQREVLDGVSRQPDLAAAWSVLRPVTGLMQFEVFVPGDDRPRSRDIADRSVVTNAVTEGFFPLMGIPVLAGRDFAATDDTRAARVAIVSAAMAERYWPGQDPIGRRLALDEQPEPDEVLTVVGLVGDVQRGVTSRPEPTMYLPGRQHESLLRFGGQYLMVRAADGSPSAAARRAAAVIADVDPAVPITGVQAVADHLGGTLMAHRLGVTLFSLFSLLALVLTALGLYAVVAAAVATRRREIGIRLALGASRGRLLELTARQGAAPVLSGVAGGALVFWLAAGLVERFMLSLPAFDAVTALAIGGGIAALAGLAMAVPARRALTVPPSEALRE